MTIRFEATGEGDAAVPELELWGTGPELPLAWEPAAPGGHVPGGRVQALKERIARLDAIAAATTDNAAGADTPTIEEL